MTVQIQLPAEPGYAALLRSAVAVVASRCDLTYDRLEDARLAVDEAFSQVLGFTSPGQDVTCSFEEAPGALRFTIATPTSAQTQVPTDSFGWTVLSALADELSAQVAEGRCVIHARVQEPQAALA